MSVCFSRHVWMIHFISICSRCTPVLMLWMNCVCVCVCVGVCVCVCVCTPVCASKNSTFSHTASITPLGFSCLRDGARGAFFSFQAPGPALFCPVLSSIGLWLDASEPGDVCCPPLPSKRPGSLFKQFLRVLRCRAQFCRTWMVQWKMECWFDS